jgi:hypothetical protein
MLQMGADTSPGTDDLNPKFFLTILELKKARCVYCLWVLHEEQ